MEIIMKRHGLGFDISHKKKTIKEKFETLSNRPENPSWLLSLDYGGKGITVNCASSQGHPNEQKKISKGGGGGGEAVVNSSSKLEGDRITGLIVKITIRGT